MEQNPVAGPDRSAALESSMKHRLIPLLIVTACVAPAGTAAERTLAHTQSAEGIDIIALDAGTADFELVAVDGATIDIEVTLIPRRGGFFSSMKDSEQEVEQAVLSAGVAGERLMLEVETDSGDRRFEERWNIKLPSRCGVEIESGVGNVTIQGIAGGAKLEVGVGNVRIEAPEGDLFVELGVGDASVKAPAASYGPVDASGGVGDARIKVASEHVAGGGFVGHSASWVGSGSHRIQVEVGVGDAHVTLE